MTGSCDVARAAELLADENHRGYATTAATTGACPEISSGAAMLADPDSPSDFSAKMLDVLREPDAAAKMRQRGLARVSEFSWKRTASIVLDALTEAATMGGIR